MLACKPPFLMIVNATSSSNQPMKLGVLITQPMSDKMNPTISLNTFARTDAND